MPIDTSLCAFMPVTSWPSYITLPSRTGMSPKRALTRVDLPAPLGPMMPMSSPWNSSRSVPLRMFTPGT